MKCNPMRRAALLVLFLGLVLSLALAQTSPPQQPTTTPSPNPTPQQQVEIPTTFADIPCPTAEEKKAWQAQWFQIDWDREKYDKKIPTDTVVIHHSADPPGMTWQRLNQIQFQNLYVPVYNSNSKDPVVKGLTPQSGHYRYDDATGVLVQIYYAYHAIVRQNGTSEPLLNLTEVGWHAGRWAENMRSLGLVMDGDYREGSGPSDKVIKGLAKQILEWKKILPLKYLKSHREVNKKTTCPGPWWDTKDKKGNTGREKLAKLTGLQLITE